MLLAKILKGIFNHSKKLQPFLMRHAKVSSSSTSIHKLETILDFHWEEKADIFKDTEELAKVVNEVVDDKDAIKLSFHIIIGAFVRSKLL